MLGSWPIQDVVLILLVVAAGLFDVHTSKVPNALTYPAVVAGLALSPLDGGWPGVGRSVLGLVVGFAPFFVLYLRGGMGGGDVKLMAAVGAIKGFPFIVNAMIASILVGGFFAIALAIWERQVLNALRFVGISVARIFYPALEPIRLEVKRPIPFAAAICLGTFLVLAVEWWHASRAPFVI